MVFNAYQPSWNLWALSRTLTLGRYRRSTLLATKYLPSLEGMVWEVLQQGEVAIDKSFQLFFRRARMDFQILKHPSDPKTKFDLFQRLNCGGAYANEQEVRTCSMVLANPGFTRQLRAFADRDDFKRIFRVTEDQVLKQDNLEYAVRLIVHSYIDFPRGRDVEEFLNSTILDVMDKQSPGEVMGRVEWTVATLDRIGGADALVPTEERHASVAQRFSLRALEGIAVGLARNMEKIQALPDPDVFVRNRIAQFWTRPDVAAMSASGLRGSTRLQRTVPFGIGWFDPNA